MSGGTGIRGVFVAVVAVALTALTLVPDGTGAAGTARDDDGRTTAPGQSPTTATADPSPQAVTEPPVTDPPVTTPPVTTPPPSTPPTPTCTPSVALVDPEATVEATCLAATLDEWQAQGEYGIGQQLNVSSRDFLDPLDALGSARPAVVGFDLDELQQGESYGFAPLDTLLGLNADGLVLTASWHTPNPNTELPSGDRSWQDVRMLLDQPGTRQSRTFWRDYDDKLDLLKRLQSGDGGAYPPAAVIFRPLHEANGNWFWWAQGVSPDDYKALYAAMQQRAADQGVHNIVWGWSPNAVTSDNIIDPMALKPDRIDLAGIDSYEPMQGRGEQDQQLDVTGLDEIAGTVPRIAVTEAGPHGSTDGRWDPTVVPRTAVAQGLRPTYILMWFDDGDGSDGYTGKKQLSSLEGGKAWLQSCDDGVCRF